MPLAAVIGHAPIVSLLKQAVRKGSVPQSLLFAGPDGVGKRAVAVALAQAINCPRRGASGDDACGTCSTCERIARGVHTDVAIVDRGEDASIKIDSVRERVLDVIGYRPFEAARRVFVIDAAEDLGDQAQDALLKTLEEPPPSAVIVLVSSYPDLLRPTVQSRCRRLRFGPLAESDVARVLTERHRVDAGRARALAAASGGSVARALAAQAGSLDEDREAAFGVVAAAKGRVGDRLRAAAALAKHDSDRRDREALSDRLTIVGSILRDLGAIAAGRRDALVNTDRQDELRSLAAAYDLRRVVAGYAAVSQAQSALSRNAGPKIVADWIAVSL
jgi:DNA polymerase-3 subunit delta'